VSVFAQINRDIWMPFRRAYAELDLPGFMAIHSAELIRVDTRDRSIQNFDEYAGRMRQGFDRATELGDALAIDFRFDQRIATGNTACERGVYRVTITSPGTGEQAFHGRFHTVSRRSADRWQLLLDHDDDEGGTVGAGDFAAAHPIDSFKTFEVQPPAG
jgi:ketosteroid isomerase-like protein